MQFNAKVKSDPSGQLSGAYQCTVTADALLLQRKKQTVLSIPRGTPTWHPAGNEISIKRPVGPLVLTVGRFAVYPSKLADAVAAFLSGKSPTINQGDVKIEPYLLIPSVAPFGIMILTRGGAIWGAVGGGIACACIAIAQAESIPRPGRAALILAINVALYAGIIALVSAAAHQ
jgi:hypothetical protein